MTDVLAESTTSVADQIPHPAWCDRTRWDVGSPDMITDEHIEGYHQAVTEVFAIAEHGGEEVRVRLVQGRRIGLIDRAITDGPAGVTVSTGDVVISVAEAPRLATAIRDASERLSGPRVGGDAT